MGWQDLLTPEGGEERVLPWTGGRSLQDGGRTWKIQGRLPAEHGWYSFRTSGGRRASLIGPADPPFDFEEGRRLVRGFLVGDRLIPDDARVEPDPDKLIEQTRPVFLVEPGLGRFSRAVVATLDTGELVFLREEFPQGPEMEVLIAFQDRKDSVGHIANVTPPLDLAFRWVSYQRDKQEERERELARLREEERVRREAEERLEAARKNLGTGAGRRAMAAVNFNEAAKAALQMSGADLLDARQGRTKQEMVVQYRFRDRRLECVVERDTLRIIDAGVCLDDHHGTKGDTFFTLESLPPVIGEAMDQRRLVVWRHVPGDPGGRGGWDDDNDDYDEDW